MTKSRGILPARQFWSEQQIEILRARYPHEKTETVAAAIGRDVNSCYTKAKKLGLHKTDEYLASADACRLRQGDNVGEAFRFKKGQTSWNKGTHFTAGGRSAETRFKKGERQGVAVKLYKPIGTERISKDGYLERKINDGMLLQKRWRAVHIVMWEEVNGPLPKGFALVFKNKDKADIRLDNLELISRSDLMKRNSYHNKYPKEVAQLIQLRGAVQRKINRREKNGTTRESTATES